MNLTISLLFACLASAQAGLFVLHIGPSKGAMV
ncbi:hypothetical protein FHT92_001945 [Rhizobium sp. BK377]|nr:hypothetical protein [Rhizobium sp. BK377]